MEEFNKDRAFVIELVDLAKKKIDAEWEKNTGLKAGEGVSFLKNELYDKNKKARPKKIQGAMDAIAGIGLALVAALLISSVYCAIENCGTVDVPVVSNGVAILNPATNEPLTQRVAQNIPLEILESQFMLALIGGIIAPVVVRVLKEKYDIQIEESQVSMIMTDAVKAVRLYHNETNRLRDENGRIPKEYAGKLKDLAFESIKTNYTDKKYKSIVASVGAQVFEKAIKEAVRRNWIENFPLEKKQVEEIIGQSIDALPQIISWKSRSEEMKEAFLDGHVRRLLHNLNVEGWAYEQLSELFEAEVNKRLISAAIAKGKGLLSELPDDKKYLMYTSTVLMAAGESLVRPRDPDPPVAGDPQV